MKYLFSIFILLGISVAARSQDTLLWSLQQCIDYAVKNNITIKKTDLNRQTAEANYIQQKNNKLPSVSGSSALNFSHGSSVDPITSSFVNNNIVSNSYGVSGQVVLYQANKANLQIEKNALLVSQSSLYKTEAENNIKLSVIQTYLQALYYHEGIAVAENAAASSLDELKQARTKFDNGAIAKKDLADVETQHAANEYAVVSAQNLYAQQVLQLKQLLELDPLVNFGIKEISLPETSDVLPEKATVFSAAAEVLPTLKIYDIQSEILKKELKITQATYKPSLSLSAGVNTGYTNTMNYKFNTQMYRNISQQVGLTLTVPIFSKKENKTNLQLAKINIEQNQLDKTAASKTLYASIETAWQNAVANQAQQASAKVAQDNAQLAYDLARKKYEYGGLTTTELAVSRNSYLNAAQTYLQSKYLATLYKELLNFYQGKNISTN